MMKDTLADIDLPLPNRRCGKVRISYDLPGEKRLFITTDRLSAFDKLIATVPRKGQVLNELSLWWFERTSDLVPNHVVSCPDPNVLVARSARPLPLEVIVRGYITGVTPTALWTRYAAGERVIYGHRLPDGLTKNVRLPAPIITPTTKAACGGRDEVVTCAEVVGRGLAPESLWDRIQQAALAVFRRGQEMAERAGLILADTKYEFGLDAAGELMLIDEVHTPDSSRFWIAATYKDRIKAGREPESLDKEIIRRALAAAGYDGDGPPPELPAEVWEETSSRYVQTYETLTGQCLHQAASPAAERIRTNLVAAGIL